MSNTGNYYYLNFCFLFLETKTLHKISLVCPYEKKKKPKRNLQKFRNIHSNSSTSPSHRHEGFGEIYKNFAIFTVTVPLVLPTGTKESEKFTKFRNIHSNSSTSPSHRHEGFNNKSQTSPPESSGNKPGRASDLYYRTFFLRLAP
jgi:hypothetical protein